jgi:hypothetical protein
MASENNEVVGGKTLVEKQSEVVEAGIIEYKGEVGVGKELQETPECESGLGVRVWGVEGGPYKQFLVGEIHMNWSRDYLVRSMVKRVVDEDRRLHGNLQDGASRDSRLRNES